VRLLSSLGALMRSTSLMDALYTAHGAELRRYVRRLCGDADTAEDLPGSGESHRRPGSAPR